MVSPNPNDDNLPAIDPAEPFKGLVVCCTSISSEHRIQIAQQVVDLGGVHKLDLTPDVTHLIVGEYDTPKYRHVARHRQDIKAMDAAWVHSVSDLWKNDEVIDFYGLEEKYRLKTFESRGAKQLTRPHEPLDREQLRICLSGFGEQNDEIAAQITANGGYYMDHLSVQSSHLVVKKPKGKKFVAAQTWGVKIVTLEWVTQSIGRGMILDEDKFDPMLPPEQQGVGAIAIKHPPRQALGKRPSVGANGVDEGARKLRRIASMKLNNQRDKLWGDILAGGPSPDSLEPREGQPEAQPQKAESKKPEQPEQPSVPEKVPVPEKEGIFSRCVFFIHGFREQRVAVLSQTITSGGGHLVNSLEEAADQSKYGSPWHQFLIVPQDTQPETHPQAPHDGLNVVTEFYIERCLQSRRFLPPDSHQAFGRPFPVFPIPGFSDLTICSAAFTDIELSQVARSVVQLGAKFEERFCKTTSVVVCKSLAAMRKEKLKCALSWGVPIVSADWLWGCISTGFKAPFDDFVFPELKAKPLAEQAKKSQASSRPELRSRSDPGTQAANGPKSNRKRLDFSGFERDSSESPPAKPVQRKPIIRADTTTSADFFTAPNAASTDTGPDPPLRELSSDALNHKPQTAPRSTTALSRTVSDPSHDKHLHTPQQPPPLSKSSSSIAPLGKATPLTPAEEAARLAKAAERQALTSKITTLLDTPDTHTANTTNGERDTTGPRPRKRQILGRAMSNASSVAAGDNASAPQSAGGGGFRDDGADEEEQAKPPSTQIGYADPEAQTHKAELMSRLLGIDAAEVPGAVAAKPPASSRVSVTTARTLRRR
ncbi:unnamed protein product [Clonostachys byssicola]|uniref:BRCT domain-containing protein n=1 Tax=Clonostachys byssicola TaxID=160290 RepID=A0A9N9UYL6_9HYPO|nr:unnamed protein product [Clonostachys byssicola]